MPRGRRRRKSASQRKPSLIFTESPLSLTHSYTSPVRCVNHPTTAQVVPVEDLADLTWVSPQFKGPVSGRRKRGRHRAELSRTSICTRSRRLDSKENLQSSFEGQKNLPRGFVPLRLQWDKSEDFADIEDVSEVETDVEFNCSRNINLQTSTTITPTSHITKNSEHDPSGPSETISRVNRLSGDHNVVSGHADNRLSGDHNVVSGHADNRLSGDHNVVSSHADNRSERLLDLSTLTHLARNSERINPRVLFTSESDSDNPSMIRPHRIRSRRSVRLRDKYTEAVDLLRSPMVVDKQLPYQVLVQDTPEHEYGKPRRPLRHKLLKQHIFPT